MAQRLFMIGATIYAVLGLLHVGLTLRDLGAPRVFTPTSEDVRRAMVTAPLRLAPQTTIWRSWLGFNLSHGLGLLLFGGLLGILALQDFQELTRNAWLRCVAVAGGASYTILAMRFWFWAPAAASATATFCFLASFWAP